MAGADLHGDDAGLSELERRLVRRAGLLVTLIGLVFVFRIMHFAGFGSRGPVELVDFDLFHIIARAVLDGRIVEAYHLPDLLALMRHYRDAVSAMPWAYPPPFDLLLAPLAFLPLPAAYALFVGASLVAWLLVLRRLAGRHVALILIATLPGVATAISCGQNGFLTGALVGAAAVGLLAGRASGGIPLGLMVVKPHLALTLGLAALVGRHARAVGVAALVAFVGAAAATLVLGPSIWPAYLSGAGESALILQAGAFKLYRMISVYAALRSVGLPADAAMLAQIVTAALVVVMVVRAVLVLEARTAFGLAILATPLVTPYVYDYDTPVVAVGLALLLPDLRRAATAGERALVLGLPAGATLTALLLAAAAPAAGPAADTLAGASLPDYAPPSPAGLLMLAMVVLAWRIAERRRPAAVPAAAAATGA